VKDQRWRGLAAPTLGGRNVAGPRAAGVAPTGPFQRFAERGSSVESAVPWLLLDNPEMPHVGTFDIDLSLDAEVLGDGKYATLVESLLRAGYEQRKDLKRFQLVRRVPAADGSPPIDVLVDFLMPRHAEILKNIPPLVQDFAVQRADGADLALRFYQLVAIDGPMPDGGRNRVEVAVASIPALLAMKGYAINGRHKQKDAYDIYYCIRNYEGGAKALAKACRPLLDVKEGAAGYAWTRLRPMSSFITSLLPP